MKGEPRRDRKTTNRDKHHLENHWKQELDKRGAWDKRVLRLKN